MTRLNWDAVPRTYEDGLDRGVLFFGTASRPVGVTWTGLVGVDEAPSGGEAKSYYIDGVKYLNTPSPTEFNATIRAITYPNELDQALGNRPLFGNGLYAADQVIRPFDFSYRTRVGAGDNPDLGYKIHLVYNALVSPSGFSFDSRSNSPSPVAFSWKFTTTPIQIPGIRPTAHLVLDTRYSTPDRVNQLENILYGTASTDSMMPSVSELSSIFGGVT